MSEKVDKIYPEIIPEREVNAMVAEKINKQNLEIIKNKYKEMSNSHKHYEKIARRYSN